MDPQQPPDGGPRSQVSPAARVGAAVRRSVPGLGLAVAVAGASLLVARLLPAAPAPVLVAMLLGLLIGNVASLPATLEPGLALASKRVLRLGVVLLGARLTIADVASIGGSALWVVVVCMAVAVLTVIVLARLAGTPPRLATLIAVGTAVCGNTAIMAVAPVIRARDREVSFAVATITIFGTSALLLFPMVGTVAGMSGEVFGFWAGLAINDTSQVVAAGAAHSAEALDVATVVKLVRNALMAPVLLLLAWWTHRTTTPSRDPGSGDARGSALRAFPAFLLGFLALVALRSVGILDAGAGEVVGEAATLLITVAIASVGLRTRISGLRRVGLRPFLVGFGAAVALAAVGLAFARWLGMP
ncbi:MAG: putative sulfate exporter family transporter [Nitriliruptoraceae bacterium]